MNELLLTDEYLIEWCNFEHPVPNTLWFVKGLCQAQHNKTAKGIFEEIQKLMPFCGCFNSDSCDDSCIKFNKGCRDMKYQVLKEKYLGK